MYKNRAAPTLLLHTVWMKARAPLLVLATLIAVVVACAKPINDGNACFQPSECRSGSTCAATAYGKFCMKKCDPEVVRCENGEACLQSSDVGFGGAGWTSDDGLGGFGQAYPAGGLGFRYLFSKLYQLRAGIDIAFSEDESAFYITTGNAWKR